MSKCSPHFSPNALQKLKLLIPVCAKIQKFPSHVVTSGSRCAGAVPNTMTTRENLSCSTRCFCNMTSTSLMKFLAAVTLSYSTTRRISYSGSHEGAADPHMHTPLQESTRPPEGGLGPFRD